MSNEKLENESFVVPEIVLTKLKGILSTFSETDKIRYFRIDDIVNKGKVSYSQMKRIKNFFDNINHNDNPEEYRKNGGTALKKWVDDTLSNARDSVEKSKFVKTEYGAMKNQYADEHNNSNVLNRDYLLKKLKIDEIFKRLR